MAFYGPYPYWGIYNPNFTYPILQSDYKMSGLLNEYDELNDLAIKNNMIYAQNIADDCKSRDIKPSTKPPGSPRDNPYYNPHYNYNAYYNNPYYPYYNYPGYYPGYPGYFPYYL